MKYIISIFILVNVYSSEINYNSGTDSVYLKLPKKWQHHKGCSQSFQGCFKSKNKGFINYFVLKKKGLKLKSFCDDGFQIKKKEQVQYCFKLSDGVITSYIEKSGHLISFNLKSESSLKDFEEIFK